MAAEAAPVRVLGHLPLNEALLRAPRRHDAGPARDLADALGPLPALHARPMPGLLIDSAPAPGRPGTLRLSGTRLTIPYAVRRLTGIAAPGSVVMTPLPGGA